MQRSRQFRGPNPKIRSAKQKFGQIAAENHPVATCNLIRIRPRGKVKFTAAKTKIGEFFANAQRLGWNDSMLKAVS